MDYLPLAMIQRCSVENLIVGGERLWGIYRMKDMNLLKGMILGMGKEEIQHQFQFKKESHVVLLIVKIQFLHSVKRGSQSSPILL